MTVISQQSVVLDSQNKLRNADRLARDWAVAHAGIYRGQAQRSLGGSAPLREWSNDELVIRMFKLTTDPFKQVQLCSIRYEPSVGTEPYLAYILTYASPQGEQIGGYCTAVVSAPDAWRDLALPWDDAAGIVGLEKLVQALSAERSRLVNAGERSGPVTAIDGLFTVHDTAIILTEDGQSDADLRELAEIHGDWAGLVNITAAEQLVIARELQQQQLPGWVTAKIATFSRYPDSQGTRLRAMETDLERVATLLDEERDRITNETANRNCVALMGVLESVSALVSAPMSKDGTAVAEMQSEPSDGHESGESGSLDSVPAQQRIFVLEDQLRAAQATILELEQRLEQYESYVTDDDAGPSDDEAPTLASALDVNRHETIMNAIMNPHQFPRLRFLTNSDKPLAAYGKPRPNGPEIVSALDAINKLAQAWYNTPNRNIGSWENYFLELPGWKHAEDESDTTMSLYGDKRSFSDQDQNRHVTITRHLTYQGSSGGLQIYFDRDDVTDTFVIGYIGEHLPYATARS